MGNAAWHRLKEGLAASSHRLAIHAKSVGVAATSSIYLIGWDKANALALGSHLMIIVEGKALG